MKSVALKILLPLFIGLLIYLVFYPENIWINQIFVKAGFRVSILSDLFQKNSTVKFAVQHLPDMLWSFSFTIFLFHFLPINNYRVRIAIILILIALSEIIQIGMGNRFTFDWWDLLFVLCTSIHAIQFCAAGNKLIQKNCYHDIAS